MTNPIESVQAKIASIAGFGNGAFAASGRLGFKGANGPSFADTLDQVSSSKRVSAQGINLDYAALGLRESAALPLGDWSDKARALGNGRLTSDMLTPISQSGHRLAPFAAKDWDALVQDAAADGVAIRITDSYRTFDQQVDLASRKGLYELGGLAAVPGTSQHGWGMAVDVIVDDDPRVKSWLNENAHRYGWVSDVAREPWHYEWRR